jgi:thiol-disulfide isomerase/thioredoxin
MNAIDRRRLMVMAAGACLSAGACRALADALPLVELPGRVQAPDFDLPDLAGDLHRLSDYRGRPVLVSFWAVWCAPCRRELPALALLQAKLRKTDISVFAVNVGDSADRIASFLADHPSPELPILLGGKATAKAWHVQALPVAYAIDCDGNLKLGALGERDWDSPDVERQLRTLDRGGPAPSQATQPIVATPEQRPRFFHQLVL